MIAITLLIAFCLISAFITFGLGIFVYTKNPKSEVNRLFFASMIVATYWALGEFLVWYPGTYDEFFFWLKVSSLWPFGIALIFHFVLTFTGHPFSKPEKSWMLICFLYIPATLFSLLGIFTSGIYTIEPGIETPFCYLPTPGSLLNLVVSLYIVLLMASAILVCFMAWRNAPPGKHRRQNRLVTVAVSTVVFFGALSGIFLPPLGFHIPNLVFIGIVLLSEIIVYAIIRYGLFTLSPETAVPDLIRMMPDGLILADTDGRVLTENISAVRILGVSGKDLQGRPLGKYLPAASYDSLCQSLLDTGTVLDFEVLLDPELHKIISISGSLVRDPEGEPAGFIFILRDITDRKATEKALATANEKISLLTQLTRHDISNLITALDGYLLLLQEKKCSEEDDSLYLRSCIDIVEKIGHQLQFTREYQDIGLHHPHWQSLDEIVELAKSDLSLTGITITKSIIPVEIFADPLVVKVFYNILENAVRHGEHITAINISAGIVQNRELRIVIEDNGIGVSDKDKERIFRYGCGKNSGLGLALSRDVLAVTGIRLIETGTPGKGARFEILIPASGWRDL
ncbi:histidine kinase N-terminal 7TM domain-containing protein [uncultured Methanoregula sp.]|uniref:histidine kinase N-terminal 7TM domain-containing protein n=1 Tax=uncultured Methanoregula sp. TaxID=1005933 RepID=UPI002AAC0AB3|nr:histidine kinase N-terminal 7TM domain-containing protein [uncultured Methanoregula sp.]